MLEKYERIVRLGKVVEAALVEKAAGYPVDHEMRSFIEGEALTPLRQRIAHAIHGLNVYHSITTKIKE